jgi:biotin-dependent carboxylase-like uncharacterized protein
MSTLEVVSCGPATSVQDTGRFGAQRYGLVPSGAMDRRSLAIANCLAGNAVFDAAIEIGPLGAVFAARSGDIRLALAGALRNATIADQTVAWNQTITLHDGEILTIGPARSGVFSYLAIEGGIRGEPVFGSLSVTARSGLGSPFARPLQAGDLIEVGSARPAGHERGLDLPPLFGGPIRVVMGPQDDEFGASRERFLSSDWTVSVTSDRMGYRLEGPRLTHDHGHNIVSDGTVDGSIQVPGNGQPIVLMKDRGTTGGYPKIATVITADLGRMAQTQPSQTVRFQSISIAAAQAEARAFHQFLQSLPDKISKARDSGVDITALQDANVAGAVVNATDSTTWQSQATEGDSP